MIRFLICLFASVAFVGSIEANPPRYDYTHKTNFGNAYYYKGRVAQSHYNRGVTTYYNKGFRGTERRTNFGTRYYPARSGANYYRPTYPKIKTQMPKYYPGRR